MVKIKKIAKETPSHFKTFYLYDFQSDNEMESQKSLMIRLFIFTLGFTAMATQVIMIRESLAIFHGNELIIGLFLGMWMILTAAGAFLAVQSSNLTPFTPQPPIPPLLLERGPGGEVYVESPIRPIIFFLFLALLPLTSLFTLVSLRFTIIPTGIMPGLGQTSLLIFLALLPFCLVSGLLFPILVRELAALKKKNLLAEGYALDSVGSIFGGLLFSLVFIFVLPSFKSLLILTFVCLSLSILWTWIISRKVLAASIIIIGIILLVLYIFLKPDQLVNNFQFRNQEIIMIKNSPFGKLAVTRTGDQLFVFENGIPVNIGDDPVYREESVHYAFLLHSGPKKALLISGGSAGIIDEILKYPIEKADYVETDPWLFRIIEKYRPFPVDKRVNYNFRDPRIFLSKTENKYDIILLNTPEPASAELNRFYTLEFFKMLKEKLNPGGIISLSVPAAGNYMSETSRMMHSVYYNTLQDVFHHIRIIPGGKDYYLASDTPLDQSFLANYKSRELTNVYVNPSYINENLQRMRSELIVKDLITEAPVNSDLKPYIFSIFLRHWLSQFRIKHLVIPIALTVMAILGFIFLGPLNLGLFAGGFTSSVLEFLLLIWFQVMYGYVYQMTGVIFAVFMTGLALGSFYRHKIVKNSTFRAFLGIQACMALFSTLVSLLFLFFPSSSPNSLIMILIMALVCLSGLLMGLQFSLSGQLRQTSILRSSGESFGADLLGSAIGILLVSVYLVPQLGLPMTAALLAGFNVVAVGVVAWKK